MAARWGGRQMKTGYTVAELGLYVSKCCNAELIFDTGDRFLKCPQCSLPCAWKLEEEIVTLDELERLDGMAA
jgi:hypothetical protein